MSRRRRARKIILDALYRMEIDSCAPGEALDDYREEMQTKEIADFVNRVVFGVTKKTTELDALIDTYADKWTANRMPILDRNILRIGIFEMKFEDDIPTSVTINEMVEMANTYSTDESGRFVNGILGKMVKENDIVLGEIASREVASGEVAASPKTQAPRNDVSRNDVKRHDGG